MPPTTETTEATEPAAGENAPTFPQLDLSAPLLDRLSELGFDVPTPIQAAAIPALLKRTDVVGIAQTGTGKTAAFGLPIVELVSGDDAGVQALVLAPTRELALQTSQAIEQFVVDPGLKVIAVYGGAPYGPQLRALREGAQIVVGTPGRVMDLIEKGALDLGDVRILVLDEADEMLRMGFAEDVETITSSVPEDRLTALFSATMPAAIERVAETHLREPTRLEVSTPASTVETIRQTYAVVPPRYKFEALTRVLATQGSGATLVFVKTRQEAENISLDLAAAGFLAAGISGDVAQHDRERLVERLRSGALDVLVATDVAARGLDVERIELVVNFDVPREREAYVHRVGRTGRAGRQGTSLTFFDPKERFRLRQIERLTGNRMEEVQIPSRADVVRDLAAKKLEQLPSSLSPSVHEILSESVASALGTGTSLHQLAVSLLAELTELGATPGARKPVVGPETDAEGYFSSSSFAAPGRKDKFAGGAGRSGRGGRRKPTASDGRFEHRYRVEVGRRDGVNPGAIVGAITGEGGLRGDALGRIDIFPSFSLVEMSEGLSPAQLRRIGQATIRGRRLRITEDRHLSPRRRGGKNLRGKA